MFLVTENRVFNRPLGRSHHSLCSLRFATLALLAMFMASLTHFAHSLKGRLKLQVCVQTVNAINENNRLFWCQQKHAHRLLLFVKMREQQSKIAKEFSTIFQNISEYSRVFKRRLIKLHQRENNHYFNKWNCSLTMSQSLHFRFAISDSFLSVNFTILLKTRTRYYHNSFNQFPLQRCYSPIQLLS